jgi:hypothetical protein
MMVLIRCSLHPKIKHNSSQWQISNRKEDIIIYCLPICNPGVHQMDELRE